MGLFKKIKKALKKVTGSATGGLLGDDEKKAAQVEAPPVAAAATVEAPKEEVKEEDTGDTEASRKAARAKGKRTLSVARSGGGGVNI